MQQPLQCSLLGQSGLFMQLGSPHHSPEHPLTQREHWSWKMADIFPVLLPIDAGWE